MVELLIAITIVVMLAAMIIVPMRGVLTGAKVSATKATILKLDQLIRQAEQEMERGSAGGGKDLAQKWAEGEFGSGALANRMAQRVRSKVNFPQRDADYKFKLNVNDPVSPLAALIQRKIDNGQFIPSKQKVETQSAAIMYLLLTEGSIYGVSIADSGSFTSAEVKDTDGDGLMEFVDAWGNPLRFYRWPTGLLRPIDSSGTIQSFTTEYWEMVSGQKKDITTLQQDPLDIRNIDGQWLTANMSEFYMPQTYYTYLIISAGPDGELGLLEPNNSDGGQFGSPDLGDSEHKDKLSDSVTNLQLVK